MYLFNEYKHSPYDTRDIKSLDTLVSYKDYPEYFLQINNVRKAINEELTETFFKDRLLYKQDYLELISFNRLLFNLLIKTKSLEIASQKCNEEIIIDVFEEELEFIDRGTNETNAKTFANLYAWIASKMPKRYRINIIGKGPKKKVKTTVASNYFLKLVNLDFKMLIDHIFYKVFSKRFPTYILIGKKLGLVREITPYLHNLNIGTVDTWSKLTNILNKNKSNLELTGTHFNKTKIILNKHLESPLVNIGIGPHYRTAYIDIVSELISDTIEYILTTKDSFRNDVKNMIGKHNPKAFLTNGIFGSDGILIADALTHLNIKIITTEHGLTAGNSKDYNQNIPVSEGRISDIHLVYNEASKSVHDEFLNNNYTVKAIGGLYETKKIRLPAIQRVYCRKKLDIKRPSVFYVSHNLCLSSVKYFPYTKSNDQIWADEIKLLNVLSKSNKEVLFKTHSAQYYLDDKRDEIFNSFAEKFSNVKYVESGEDFRYIRTAADIIITQGSESTLGWCIGSGKPIIFLDSNFYEPLADERVRDAFQKSFFVVNYDEDKWEEKLLNLLNMPLRLINKKWMEKNKYRKEFDHYYFLDSKKRAGPAGANYINSTIKKIDSP